MFPGTCLCSHASQTALTCGEESTRADNGAAHSFVCIHSCPMCSNYVLRLQHPHSIEKETWPMIKQSKENRREGSHQSLMMRHTPQGFADGSQAVCVFLDVKPVKGKDEKGQSMNDYWKSSVALLNEKDFLGRLKNYDKDNIPPKLIDKVRTGYLSNETFTPDNAKKASPAAEGMCKWLHAMSSYEKVCPSLQCMDTGQPQPAHQLMLF